MKLELIGEFRIPTYAVTYFEYGESDSLDSEDILNCDEFYNDLVNRGYQRLIFEWPDEWSDDYREFDSMPEFGLATSTLNTKVFGVRNAD